MISRRQSASGNAPPQTFASPGAALLLPMLLAALAGCSRAQQVPAASLDLPGTIAALSTENSRLETQAAPGPTTAPPADLGRLAYVQGGDIWVRFLPGGLPLRLTIDGGSQEPRWSSSGDWLAYRSGESQVWLYNLDGGEARPLNEGRVVEAFDWSPLEDRVVYADGSELYVESGDGTARTTLLAQDLPGPGRGAQGRVGGFAWSPTGEWIAYEWREGPEGAAPTYQGIWVVSPDGGVRGDAFQGDGTIAGWSSDGRNILFWEGMDGSASLAADGLPLRAVPPEGGDPITIASVTLPHADFIAVDPASPARLAVVSGGGREVWTGKELVLARIPAGESNALSLPGQAASSPSWSGDAERVAFSAMPAGIAAGEEAAREALMQRRIWIVDIESGALTKATSDEDYRDERPLWSAEGSMIVFARLDDDDRASLWMMPAEGGEPERMVEELTPAPGWAGYYGHIQWDLVFDWWRGPPEWITGPRP